MENMDKGLTAPKLVLINRVKIPQIPPNLMGRLQSVERIFIDLKLFDLFFFKAKFNP